VTQNPEMMENGDGAEDSKKPYEPPKVTRVSLRPEEAVLGACKTTTGTGPASSHPCSFGLCGPLPGS
jgi:hypothetical protein